MFQKVDIAILVVLFVLLLFNCHFLSFFSVLFPTVQIWIDLEQDQ